MIILHGVIANLSLGTNLCLSESGKQLFVMGFWSAGSWAHEGFQSIVGVILSEIG